MLVITFILIFFVRVKEFSAEERAYALAHEPKGVERYIEKSALPISIIAFLAGFIDSAILTGMGSFSTDLKIPLAGSLFFTMYAVLIFVSRPFTGRLFDTKGDNWNFFTHYIYLCQWQCFLLDWPVSLAQLLALLSY
ncbi:MFS transporter [Lactococcus lactis]|uniref:hypothetical protein n=1 Tax=Lactococcus lactis TaxID=1358 RepID=UPI002905A6A6|nr:hypothetical protein [Lactococcus lactis]